MMTTRITLASSLLTLAFIALSGCATTQSLSPEQCQTTDWKQLGKVDGQMGRSGAYFGKHVDDCTGIAGSEPNRILWEEGRQEGLKDYCTELNAYKLGREGYAWQPVCPLEGIEKLEEAYGQGRYYYLRQRELEYLSSPYPWGYGGRYGYYGPRHWVGPYLRPVW